MGFDLHVHTRYSMDSLITPKKLVNVARRYGLQGIAVTDHNTIQGGIETQKYCSNQDFLVIIGSEIKTTMCEIIGLFLQDNIDSTDPFTVLDVIHAQDGISVLTHPYRSFSASPELSQEIIDQIDLIEGYNSRTKHTQNQQAVALASNIKKPVIAGSDAHFYQELGRATTRFSHILTTEDEIRQSLLKGETYLEIINMNYLHALPFIFLSGIYSRIRKIS